MEAIDTLYTLILKRSTNFDYSYKFDSIMAGKIDISGNFVDFNKKSYYHITNKIVINRLLDKSYVFTFRIEDLYGFFNTNNNEKVINDCSTMLENVSFKPYLNNLYMILDIAGDQFGYVIDPNMPMELILAIIARELKKKVDGKNGNLIQFPKRK